MTDKEGRDVHLYLNSYKHIINYHDKFEVWAKHWRGIIQDVVPGKVGNAWYYEKKVDGLDFQIRVVKEQGIYLIKTAIISEGTIGRFERA